MYQRTSGDSIIHISGALIPADPSNSDYAAYLEWLDAGNVPDPASAPASLTQFELDTTRYRKRDAAKGALLAYMAADNMSRVRAGTWTVPDLVALSGDPEIAALLNDVNTLSFELAVSRLSSITNPMLTPAIKADWAARLTEHFYLVP